MCLAAAVLYERTFLFLFCSSAIVIYASRFQYTVYTVCTQCECVSHTSCQYFHMYPVSSLFRSFCLVFASCACSLVSVYNIRYSKETWGTNADLRDSTESTKQHQNRKKTWIFCRLSDYLVNVGQYSNINDVLPFDYDFLAHDYLF